MTPSKKNSKKQKVVVGGHDREEYGKTIIKLIRIKENID